MTEKALPMDNRFRASTVMTLAVLVTAASGSLMALYPAKFSLFAAAMVLLGILTMRHPEIILALFLTAGLYKGDPRFQVPHLDLTVFFAGLTLVSIVRGVYRKRIKLELPPFRMYFPFLIISGMSALSLMYTIAPVYGTEKFLRFVTLTSIAFFAPLYLFQDTDRHRTFPSKYRNFLVTYIFLTTTMLFDTYQKGGLAPDKEYAVAAFSSNYLSMGQVMGTAFILTLMYLFMSDSSIPRRAFYILALCPATMYGLMISGARGPVIALAITMAVIPVWSRGPHEQSRKIMIWVVIMLAVAGVFFWYTYNDFARMTYRMTALEEVRGNSVIERIYMAKSALEAMTKMPYILTGLGIGGFSMYYRGFDAVRGVYPHNILLELGSETGVAGLAAGILLLFWSFKKASMVMKKITGEAYFIAVSASAILLYAALNAFKSGDLNDHRIFFAYLGLIYSLDRETSRYEDDRTDGTSVDGAEPEQLGGTPG